MRTTTVCALVKTALKKSKALELEPCPGLELLWETASLGADAADVDSR